MVLTDVGVRSTFDVRHRSQEWVLLRDANHVASPGLFAMVPRAESVLDAEHART